MAPASNDAARSREHPNPPGAAPDLPAKEAILAGSRLAKLSGPARAQTLAAGTLELLGKGRILVAQGEAPRVLFLLRSGRVRVERTGKGDALLPLGHRGPGDWVGEGGFGGANTAEAAIVVEAAHALRLPFQSLRRVLDGEGRAREVVAAALVEAEREVQVRLETLLTHGIEVRLARFLLDAVARWGAAHESGRALDTGFTHAEIAAAIGSTRETVTLMLGKLRRDGVLAVARRRLVVRDQAALTRRAMPTKPSRVERVD